MYDWAMKNSIIALNMSKTPIIALLSHVATIDLFVFFRQKYIDQLILSM